MICDELNGFLGHAVFDVFVGDIGVRIEVLELPRTHITSCRPRTGPVGYVHVESMLQWRIGFGAQMPLSEMAGHISGVTERLSQSIVIGMKASRGIRNGCMKVRGRLFSGRGLKPRLR